MKSNRFFTLLLAASCLTAVGQVPDYVPTDGLVGWFSLDDESLEESSLTPLNAPQFGLNRFGQEGACSVFDGNQELTTSGLEYENFTISIWFKPSESAGDICHGLISQNEGVDCTPLMHVALCNIPAQLNCQVRYTSCMADKVECDYLSGQWQHLAFTREGSIIQVFWNGVVVDENIAVDHTLSPQAQLRIGSLPYGGLFRGFEGDIDDVGIWNRTLTPDEILEIYNAPAPLMGCNDESACNFNSLAAIDDGSCHFLCEYCKEGTVWDEAVQGCIVANPADINLDGCVQLNDLLDLLSAYGDCGAEESAWQCGDPLEYQGYDYATVQIGEQCWFAENLRAENYRNGDEILTAATLEEWNNTDSGATAIYGEGEFDCVHSSPDFNACNPTLAVVEYGRLYNGYTVVDARGVCPSGWGVPSDGMWMDMEVSLGMTEEEAGGTGNRGEDQGQRLKSTTGWAGTNNGNNLSGFSGQSSGRLLPTWEKPFLSAGEYCYWWSSSMNNTETLWARRLNFDNDKIGRYSEGYELREGLSIRCIKDAE